MSGYTAKQAEEDTLSMLKVWVWSGFRSESEAADMLEDHLSEEDALTDPDAIRKALAAEFKTKAAAEKSWPKETDCDRLDRAFDALMAAGICALHNAGYTQSDGHADVAQELHDQGREKFHGYCFYHGQDVERAVHAFHRRQRAGSPSALTARPIWCTVASSPSAPGGSSLEPM